LDLPDRQCRLDTVYFLDPVVRYILHPGYSAGLIFSDERGGVQFLNASLYVSPD